MLAAVAYDAHTEAVIQHEVLLLYFPIDSRLKFL